jgi:putative cell wall-binding protein
VNELGKIHATQAFLMENIKAKSTLINKIKTQKFETKLKEPVRPTLETYKNVKEVDESWGLEQLSESEYNEYLESTAIASHIGQFIHRGSPLDRLRKELPTIPAIEFFELKKDEKIPVKITVHHNSEQLLNIHNQLAKQHREAEMRANYFKARVKNLVTLENSRIAQKNADAQSNVNNNNKIILEQFNELYRQYNDQVLVESQEFESKRNEDIEKASALRINIDPRFQEIIDLFLDRTKKEEDH